MPWRLFLLAALSNGFRIEAERGLAPDASAQACEGEIKALKRHVEAFCIQVQPALRRGDYEWLTHVRDVDPRAMAARVKEALQWGRRDESHGLLFSRESWKRSNTSLLLWGGVTQEQRKVWCRELNLFMLHADGDDEGQRTPFGSLLEMEGVKDQHGQLFGDCSWARVAPIWQSASDAVVLQNGNTLVRVLLNKPLLGDHSFRQTIFYHFELPTLARYPPMQGLKVFNVNLGVKCRHLMPILRHRIEENGLLEDWRQVENFVCVDAPDTASPRDLDGGPSVQFLRPGEALRAECIEPKTQEVYESCRDKGHIDFDFFKSIAGQFAPGPLNQHNLKLSGFLHVHGNEAVRILPDVAQMFDTSIIGELIIAQCSKPQKFILDAVEEMGPEQRRLGRNQAVASFRNVLTESRTWQREALTALGCLKATEAIPELVQLYADLCANYTTFWNGDVCELNGWLAAAVVKSMKQMGEMAEPGLAALVRDFSNAKTRAAAVAILGELGLGKADLLRTVREDNDIPVVCSAALALGKIGGSEVLHRLGELLTLSESPRVRVAAALGLGHLGKLPKMQTRAADLLEPAQGDADRKVQTAAARSLQKLGRKPSEMPAYQEGPYEEMDAAPRRHQFAPVSWS